MLLGQCSLCQGPAATATYRKTDPAKHRLEVRTDTPSTPPPTPLNCLRHTQASLFDPHPNNDISATVSCLVSAKSYKRLNCTHNGIPSTQGSVQKKVADPSPTLLVTCSSNHLLSCSPPSQIRIISFHHNEPLRPPTRTLRPSTPYQATNTQYHNPSLSTIILQHHLPRRAMLNSLNCLTPKPPYSFRKQITRER
jgi:hypothetical protein